MEISPSVYVNRPDIIDCNVVLPAPLWPNKQNVSPKNISILKSVKAYLPFAYLLLTFLIQIYLLFFINSFYSSV